MERAKQELIDEVCAESRACYRRGRVRGRVEARMAEERESKEIRRRRRRLL